MTDEQFEAEVQMLKYFWEAKDDITRYVGFEELKPELERRRPDILQAWERYKRARDILDAVFAL